jgi:hypothetical protein
VIARRTALVSLAITAALLLPGANAAAQVRFDRAGFRLTSIGERIAVSGRVVDGRRRPVTTSNLRFRVADPKIATVSQQGILTSHQVGYTKLWAVSGRDSASAIIVVDQWAADFDFAPAVVRLDAVGAKTPLRILVKDAAGHLINDQTRKTTACRSLNDRVATLAANGEVAAKSNGSTWIRCTDRGIADSVLVEVRQRVARATIADKQIYSTRSVGDTFRLVVRAVDRSGDEIKSAPTTWASLLPTAVSIDPVDGRAEARAPGETKIIAQAGDVTDTLKITVIAPPGYTGPLAAAPDSAPTVVAEGPKSASLKLNSAFPMEGDTTAIQIIARDPTGKEVTNPDVRLRSSDTSVVAVLSGRRVIARKSGLAWIYGAYGNIVDSASVTVRTRSAARATDVAENTTSSFKRPEFNIAGLNSRYKNSRDSALKIIFDSSRVVGLKTSGRLLRFSATAGQASHSFHDTTGVEARSGLMYGAGVELAPFRQLQLSGDFRTGVLSTTAATGGNDLAITEVSGDLRYQASPSFAFGVGGFKRGVREGEASAPLARQKWVAGRVSLALRNRFIGGAVGTTIVASVMPFATYTGAVDPQTNGPAKADPFSFSGETGVDLRFGWFNAGLVYYVEKFTFPKAVGTDIKRTDQFSMLRLRLGLQAGH